MSPSADSALTTARETRFDSRRLNSRSLYACELAAGSYVLTSAESPELNGAINVTPRSREQPMPTTVVLTTNAEGKLVFSNDTQPPFAVEEGAYLMINYFNETGADANYSIQIVGMGRQIDSRALSEGQLCGCIFETAEMLVFQAYLLSYSDGGDPLEYVLKFEGELHIRDDSLSLEPVVIELDPELLQIPPVVAMTGFPVTWEAQGGPWYVIVGTVPPALRSKSKQ